MSRVLLITHIYPPAIDGGSQVIYKIGEYFKNQGHQVLILTSNAHSTDDFTHSYNHIPGLGLPVYTSFHRPLKLLSKVLSKGPIFKLIPFIKFLISCYLFHPEYIIAGPMPTTIIIYAHFIKKLTGAKLIINASFHPTDPEFHQSTLIRSLKSADLIWTLTQHETKYFHNHFNIPFSKMILLGNGIDKKFIKTKWSKPKSKFNLLYIGSFAAHKNIEVLIDALCLLNKKYQLTLAGQKTLHSPRIIRKISSLPPTQSKRIKIIYNFKSVDKKKIIDSSSILISPSTQESFGLVLLEAMARGIPFIAADIPASIELAKMSGAGHIFKQGNPHNLAQNIINIKPNHNGIAFALTHTWDRIGKSLWRKILSL